MIPRSPFSREASVRDPSKAPPRVLPTILGWQRLAPDEGHAYGRVLSLDDARIYEGWEVIAGPSGGYACRFRLVVGPDGITRALEVEADGPRGLRRLSVRRSLKGQWWADGKRRADLDGPLDADVAATPLTNTPAIRRLGLSSGDAADIEVVWVDVPSLAIAKTAQRYERLERDRYRFTAGDFMAEVTVDDDGLVRDHEHFAGRIFRI